MKIDIDELAGAGLFAEPPCLAELKSVPSLLQRGQVIAMPGFDLPECDEDGFYMPLQCHTNKTDGEDWCWCVDRNGGVVEGTYKRGYHECRELVWVLF